MYLGSETSFWMCALSSWATSRFICGDLTLVHDSVERHESVNADTWVLATLTTAGADIDRNVHEVLHQDNAIEEENAHLKLRIAQVVKEAKKGEEKLVQDLAQVKLDLVKAEAHGGELAAADEALGEELQAEQERSEGLVNNSRALRE
jgi:regulator of replication initiation timing